MVQSNLPFLREPEPVYTLYKSADEIEYTPENALQEGVAMVKELSGCLKKIDIGSKLRKDVWIQDIETWVPHFLYKTSHGLINLPVCSNRNRRGR
jgi:hypothetical protein